MADEGLDFAALLPNVNVFGGVRRFLEIGNELVRRGHRYVLYHPDGARPDWLPFDGEVRSLAALRNASHAVLLTADPGLVAEFDSAPARVKLFYCVHKNLPGRAIARHPGWTLLANSSGLRQRLWRRYRVRAEDAIGGVDVRLFKPPADGVRPAGEPFRVLVYGRLSRSGKGTNRAIRAVEHLASKLSRRWPARAGPPSHPVKLVLFDHVGPGNERDPRHLLRCRIPYEFHLNLQQEELAALYASCDVFVSAERRAGWNNTVAEAMACGVPVACTRAGTLDLAVHRHTAWVVRWPHPFFLSRALQALRHDPTLRQRLRGAALEKVREFSWERVAVRIEAIARSRLAASADHS